MVYQFPKTDQNPKTPDMHPTKFLEAFFFRPFEELDGQAPKQRVCQIALLRLNEFVLCQDAIEIQCIVP